MLRRGAAVLLALVILGGCGSPASSSPTGPAPTVSPAGGTASAQAPAPTALPSGSGDAARLARFEAHVVSSASALGPLLDALEHDSLVSDGAAVARDIASIQAWDTAESAWLAANPYATCYGVLFTQWDTARAHAAKVASRAAAGAYDQFEVADARGATTRELDLITRASSLCG